jgi:hypothetical protein
MNPSSWSAGLTRDQLKSSGVQAAAWPALTEARRPGNVRVLMARFVFFVIVIELRSGAGGGGALS